MKRTLKRELKVLEIVKREAVGTSEAYLEVSMINYHGYSLNKRVNISQKDNKRLVGR